MSICVCARLGLSRSGRATSWLPPPFALVGRNRRHFGAASVFRAQHDQHDQRGSLGEVKQSMKIMAERKSYGVSRENESRKSSRRRYVGAIDQGTTSTRFFVFDDLGKPVASHQVEFKQIYPQSGWMEHDPYEILASVKTCIEAGVEKFSQNHSVHDIESVGLTTQRETTVVWDSRTGKALHNAIVWPDTRTQALVRVLQRRPDAEKLRSISGLPLSTYPSAVKLRWLLDNVESVKDAYENECLAFGTMDSWLLFQLNGTQRNFHVTDVTNASRTMLMNLDTLDYDRYSLAFFGLDWKLLSLPKIVPCSSPDAFGRICEGLLKDVPITGCLGDQSAALVGQLALSSGRAKNTYGTGCFMLYNVGSKPVSSSHGLLSTVAYHFGAGSDPTYALEGSIAVAGSAVKFLQHNLGLIEASHHINDLAATVDDSGGCVFVTAFSGLFAPYWIDDAKGTIFGITAHTQKGHLARATMEATCFQTRAILEAMQHDSGQKLEELAVDGGMSNSDMCMQTQADIIGIPINRPAMRETTALGAAITAGLAVGIWKDLDDVQSIGDQDREVFYPRIAPSTRDNMYSRWRRAVEMSRGWTADLEDTNIQTES